MPYDPHAERGPAVEYFGTGFGWTTPFQVSEWFRREYERYANENRLKVVANARFHRKKPLTFHASQVNFQS